MLDRGAALRQYEFEWSTIDTAFAVSAMRALMLVLIVVAAVWGLYGVYRRFGMGSRWGAGNTEPRTVPLYRDDGDP
jgi:hypothetical protein